MAQLRMMRGLQILVILIVVVLNVVPIVPTLVDQGRDSGVYAYTAKVLYDGGLPYRDAWDNKAPGIYFINAIGFKLFGVTRWAIWAMELVFIGFTAIFFYLLLSEVFPRQRTVFVGTLLFILMARHADLVGNGNLTESFAILPQVMFFWLGYRFLKQPSVQTGFLLGLISSMAFLIRQNAIGMALSFVPTLWFVGMLPLKSGRSWRWVLSMVAGGLFGLGLTTVYFVDAIPEAYSAIVVSPSKLHHWVIQETIYPWTAVIRTIFWPTARFLFWTLIPFIGYAMVWTKRHWRDIERPKGILLVWISMTFLLDLYMMNLTGQAYSHYYITLVPTTMMLLTIAYDLLHGKPRWIAAMTWVYIGILTYGMVIGQYNRTANAEGSFDGEIIEHPLSTYVQEHTESDDYVLVWGISSFINFQSGRDSPTQYHYGYPLIVPDYTEPEFIKDLMDDLNRNQPVLIIDRTLDDGNRIPPVSADDRRRWFEDNGRTDTTDLSVVFAFVEDFCTPIDLRHRARIYRCVYE